MDEANVTPAPEAADTGQAEGAAPAVEPQTPEAPADVFDYSEFGDRPVELTVRGEKVYKPLREAINGAMMQEDYTRKSQELAAQAQEVAEARTIQAALDNNPAEAIRLLDEIYETNLFSEAAARGEFGPEAQEELDPEDQWRERVDGFMQSQEQQQLEAQIETDLNELATRYNDPNLDKQAVVDHALRNNILNLDAAYRHMKWDEAQTAAAERAREEDRKAKDAKRDAEFVEGGRGIARGATTATPPEGFASVVEAYHAAQEELGQRR